MHEDWLCSKTNPEGQAGRSDSPKEGLGPRVRELSFGDGSRFGLMYVSMLGLFRKQPCVVDCLGMVCGQACWLTELVGSK